MKLLQSKIVFGMGGLILGAALMFGAQLLVKERYVLRSPIASAKQMEPLFDQFFNDDFFGRSRDPFEEMRRMRAGMLKQFDSNEGGGIFDSWFRKKFGGGNAADIKQREDAHFVYYDISVEGLKPEKVTVKVENGQVAISGQVERKSEQEGSNSYFSSSFHRSFPAPLNVDANKAQIEQQKDRLVVKFPKIINDSGAS